MRVKWKQAERIAEWIVEDADVHAGLRSCRERLSERTANGVSPDDVVLEKGLRSLPASCASASAR